MSDIFTTLDDDELLTGLLGKTENPAATSKNDARNRMRIERDINRASKIMTLLCRNPRQINSSHEKKVASLNNDQCIVKYAIYHRDIHAISKILISTTLKHYIVTNSLRYLRCRCQQLAAAAEHLRSSNRGCIEIFCHETRDEESISHLHSSYTFAAELLCGSSIVVLTAAVTRTLPTCPPQLHS